MIEGSRSGSGSIPLSNGSGSGSMRPKNTWIRIRIRNTVILYRYGIFRPKILQSSVGLGKSLVGLYQLCAGRYLPHPDHNVVNAALETLQVLLRCAPPQLAEALSSPGGVEDDSPLHTGQEFRPNRLNYQQNSQLCAHKLTQLDYRTVTICVADPGCLSRILIFSIPDTNFFQPGFRIRIK